jgi:hypothetical protein
MPVVTVSLEVSGLKLMVDLMVDKPVVDQLPAINEAAYQLERAFDLPGVKALYNKLVVVRGDKLDVVERFDQIDMKLDKGKAVYYCKNEQYSRYGFKIPSSAIDDYLRMAENGGYS